MIPNLAIKIRDTVSDKLTKLRARFGNLRPVWPKIANQFYAIERAQFAGEGRRANPWRPLTPAYKKAKAVRYPGKPILQASGRLMRSLTSRGAAGAVYSETATSLTLGSSDPTFAYHQKGTERMPQRKPIDLTVEDKREMGRLARLKFEEDAKELGFVVVSHI